MKHYYLIDLITTDRIGPVTTSQCIADTWAKLNAEGPICLTSANNGEWIPDWIDPYDGFIHQKGYMAQ